MGRGGDGIMRPIPAIGVCTLCMVLIQATSMKEGVRERGSRSICNSCDYADVISETRTS